MTTIYPQTGEILDALRDICDPKNITIKNEHTNWHGKPYRSDYVILEAEHKVGFEVLENEIIAFYFGDHCHFEDYTSELAEGQAPYVQRAIDFFRRFFTTPLQLLEKRKGRRKIRSEWFFLLPDGRKESIAGPRLVLLTNPFVKPTASQAKWSYCKAAGQFFCIAENSTIVPIQGDILLEIHKRDGMYSYTILQNLYDAYSDDYFWTPAGQGCSLFDTEEKAIQAAKDEAKTLKPQE